MMTISVMFWNVERFAGGEDRTERVERHIRDFGPDIFCLCEIRDKVTLRRLIQERFTDYDFGLTDGDERIELLTAWRRGAFEQVLFTQRREFKAGSKSLRPGALLSTKVDDSFYNFLFLHTDSGTELKDYENRQAMFRKVWKLKEKLDEIVGGEDQARLAVLGDLNTMGKAKEGQFDAVSAEQEIADLAEDATNAGMSLLSKTHDETLAWKRHSWEPEYRLSNLDHGLATVNLNFETLKSPTGVRSANLRVDGWQQLTGDDRTFFIENVSDHCSIFGKLS